MKALRRILGVLVMIAGILGLLISLAGLVGVWVVRPNIAGYVDSIVNTLNTSIDTSKQAMEVTWEALGATIDSVDALSSMLDATATSVEDTQPVLDQVNSLLGETLPATFDSATTSLNTARDAAEVLDGAIKSLDTFRFLLSSAPLVGGFVEKPDQPYNPETSLADSLGELASNLEGLPAVFSDMSTNLDKADDNLVVIKDNLTTMSDSVGRISGSLSEYQTMIRQSQASMDNMRAILTTIQGNLGNILNVAAIVLDLFFFWLLIAQVVIISQGWELYQGTAGQMESGEGEAA